MKEVHRLHIYEGVSYWLLDQNLCLDKDTPSFNFQIYASSALEKQDKKTAVGNVEMDYL